jgi:putative SbcD/Mre11-related phosphoesterase
MTATPLVNEPALVVENSIKVLVVADVHLGIEWELYHRGFSIPSQVEKRKKLMLDYIESIKPDRVVILGDIKHNVPRTSWQEKNEVPDFLKALVAYVPVDIVPGNHDGGIEELVSENVSIHSARGFVLDSVGYFHGHTWPDKELMSTGQVVMSHNHPTIRLKDTLGHVISEKVWIKTRFIGKAMKKYFGDITWSDPEVIIMPAFNELCGGIPFNESIHEDLLGPVFAHHAIELEKASVFLLDGTNLGTIGNIRKLALCSHEKISH